MGVAYIIRHGETDSSQNDIIQGQNATPLNAVGISTANRLSNYIAHNIMIEKIITSDLKRCVQTAEIIKKQITYPIIYEETPFLREISLGIFEGKPMSVLEKFRKESGDYNGVIPPEGESINELTCRVMKWFHDNCNILSNSLIITHKGVISVIADNAISKLSSEEECNVLKQSKIIILIWV